MIVEQQFVVNIDVDEPRQLAQFILSPPSYCKTCPAGVVANGL
jgi:hypothetical protein